MAAVSCRNQHVTIYVRNALRSVVICLYIREWRQNVAGDIGAAIMALSAINVARAASKDGMASDGNGGSRRAHQRSEKSVAAAKNLDGGGVAT